MLAYKKRASATPSLGCTCQAPNLLLESALRNFEVYGLLPWYERMPGSYKLGGFPLWQNVKYVIKASKRVTA